jgi:hypothetical protein
MVISSRTPEGEPDCCGVCLKPLMLEASEPTRDATCPYCGSLVWFEPRNPESSHLGDLLSEFKCHPDGEATKPVFRCIVPDESIPIREEIPTDSVLAATAIVGRSLPGIVRRWSPNRRRRDRSRVRRILQDLLKCRTREALETRLGLSRFVTRVNEIRCEYYENRFGTFVLLFDGSILFAVIGNVPFSSLENGAGIPPDRLWFCTRSPGGEFSQFNQVADSQVDG